MVIKVPGESENSQSRNAFGGRFSPRCIAPDFPRSNYPFPERRGERKKKGWTTVRLIHPYTVNKFAANREAGTSEIEAQGIARGEADLVASWISIEAGSNCDSIAILIAERARAARNSFSGNDGLAARMDEQTSDESRKQGTDTAR